uniref:Uncharacterized protein n=1 Tax=Panagrolaimus sp. ES5 TaxID=591445 RepID=A0AC34F0R0_9BILA
MHHLQKELYGGGGNTDSNNNNDNNKKFGTNETLSQIDERMVQGCHHRHSSEDGPHLARELHDGAYSFANGDCQLIGKDVASFFDLEHLIQSVSLQIETLVEADKLIEAFRLAEVTDAKLCKRLWQRILAEFSLLFENNTFICLTPSELEQCFFDSKFNIRVTKDSEILKKYRGMNVPGAPPIENYARKKEIERIFGREVEGQQQLGALGSSHIHKRIPHEVIVAHAGWGENGPTSEIEIYDYHSEKWISPKMADHEESPRAYHGIAVIDKG